MLLRYPQAKLIIRFSLGACTNSLIQDYTLGLHHILPKAHAFRDATGDTRFCSTRNYINPTNPTVHKLSRIDN